MLGKQKIGVAAPVQPDGAQTETETLQTTLSTNKTFESELTDDPDIDRLLRMGFVRKVYGILFVQLVCTFGLVAAFQTNSIKAKMMECPGESGHAMGGAPSAPDFAHYPATCTFAWADDELPKSRQQAGHATDNKDGATSPSSPYAKVARPTSLMQTLLYGGYFAGFVAYCALVCCINNARSYPRNYMLLSFFTVCWSFFVAAYAVQSQMGTVLLAAGMTTAITGALSLFACQTKIDFTGIGGYLMAGCWALILLVFVLPLFSNMLPGWQKLYLGLGVIMYSLFLVYDTQLLVGGKHRTAQLGLDDYVIAALMIYVDIVQLFLYHFHRSVHLARISQVAEFWFISSLRLPFPLLTSNPDLDL